ncbi:MAG: type II secretion system F family protein [Chloroflexi bacterium]|nr:type II secretion system F family protein [Chloroflexota bacterium]
MITIGEYGMFLTVLLSLVFASVGLLVVAALAAGTQQATQERLQRYTSAADAADTATPQAEVLRDRRYSSIGRLDVLLHNHALADAAARDLAMARVPLRAGEYFLLMLVCGAVSAYLALTLTASPVAGAVAGLLGVLAPRMYVNRRKAQRVKALEDQLVDFLSLCSNTLRSGWGFLQALEHAAQELPAPISEEIRQVLQEVSLGASPEQALHAMQQRIPSYDLELIVTAVLIQRKVGGNLAEMLDNIAHTIRARVELLGEIRIVTAESRMSMWVLALLPIFLLLILSSVQPTYIRPLLVEPTGRLILMVAAGLEFIGILVLRRMATINV